MEDDNECRQDGTCGRTEKEKDSSLAGLEKSEYPRHNIMVEELINRTRKDNVVLHL